MRERYPLPFIRREQYDTFRSLPGSDLSDTYDEWLKLHAKEKLERDRVGYDAFKVEVDPYEFQRFCSRDGVACDGYHLLLFAIEKAAGRNY